MGNFTKKLVSFLILNFGFSSIFYYFIINKGSLNGSDIYIFGLMWMPTISAFITQLIYDKNIKGFGWKLGKLRYLAASYLVPLIAGLIVYSIVWVTGIGRLSFNDLSYMKGTPVTVTLVILATLGVVMSGLTALGEEIGWRGYLVPLLAKKYSYTATSLISAVIWALYHYPLMIFADYNNGVSIGFSLFFFTISITAISFIATYLRLKSGSVWTAVILHASHNLFIQAIFDVITVDGSKTRYFTTEFGAGLALVYSIIAIYCWKNSNRINMEKT